MKKFIVIGNTGAVNYKEIFPYLKDNKMWVGATNFNVGLMFRLPDNYTEYKYIDENGNKIGRVSCVCWWTNVEHKKRNAPLDLYKRYSNEYPKYDNFDAIEVGKFPDIPMDYDGIMGVPTTFIGHYNPAQFEIIGLTNSNKELLGLEFHNNCFAEVNGKRLYSRLLIRKRKN